jgi:hypothetical protein
MDDEESSVSSARDSQKAVSSSFSSASLSSDQPAMSKKLRRHCNNIVTANESVTRSNKQVSSNFTDFEMAMLISLSQLDEENRMNIKVAFEKFKSAFDCSVEEHLALGVKIEQMKSELRDE